MRKLPSTPDKHRIYAIGDIHGRVDLLARLLSMIETDSVIYPEKQRKLIFLGDYIDRGIDSRGVIERLSGSFAKGLQPVFVRGNHDDRFIRFLEGQLDVAPAWLQLGGAAAMASYGVNAFSCAGANRLEFLHKELSARIPDSHREFLNNTVFSVTYGDYYFVHAGIKPGIPLAKQVPEDQMWIRGEFLFSDKDFGKTIVHGHTIRPEPEVKTNRIGIDTGAFASGRLTCLILDGTERRFITT